MELVCQHGGLSALQFEIAEVLFGVVGKYRSRYPVGPLFIADNAVQVDFCITVDQDCSGQAGKKDNRADEIQTYFQGRNFS